MPTPSIIRLSPCGRICLACLLCCVGSPSLAISPAPESRTEPARELPANNGASPAGELRLTGKSISMLVLERQDYGELVLKSPGPVVTLPAGDYSWHEVCLQVGKGPVYASGSFERDWFRIAPGKPAVLAIGGPLEPVLNVYRRGDKLLLSHHLRGADGEHYAAAGQAVRPRFTVRQNGRETGSGQFEFG